MTALAWLIAVVLTSASLVFARDTRCEVCYRAWAVWRGRCRRCHLDRKRKVRA